MAEIRKVVLAKSADWDTWNSFVKTRVSDSGIWGLINPDLTSLPAHPVESVEPKFEPSTNPAQLNQSAYELYRQQIQVFKLKQVKYKKQQRAFEGLIAFIHETIISQNFIYIQKAESHSWHQLCVLKARLALTNEARSLRIESRYHKLCERSRNMNSEAWLKNWQVTYTNVKTYVIAEVTGRRPIRDFLMIIANSNTKTYLITFADNHLMNLTESSTETDMYEKFRAFARLRERSKDRHHDDHFAFSVKSQGPIFNG